MENKHHNPLLNHLKPVVFQTEDFTSDLLKARDHAVAEKERMQSELDSLKRIRSGMGTRADPFSMEASQVGAWNRF